MLGAKIPRFTINELEQHQSPHALDFAATNRSISRLPKTFEDGRMQVIRGDKGCNKGISQ